MPKISYASVPLMDTVLYHSYTKRGSEPFNKTEYIMYQQQEARRSGVLSKKTRSMSLNLS